MNRPAVLSVAWNKITIDRACVRAGDGGPVVAAASLSGSDADPVGAADCEAAVVAPVRPAWIRHRLGVHPSTCQKVLSRYKMGRLSFHDPPTGRVVRRYEHTAPGDLVHVDIKKLGRIPDGGGHKVHGRAVGNTIKKTAKPGMRPAQRRRGPLPARLLQDLRRREEGDRRRVLDSSGGVLRLPPGGGEAGPDRYGPCYRSNVFANALGTIVRKWTRPYRPQTNGKVERFNRTLIDEWAYGRFYLSETERAEAVTAWLHQYNYHRGHTSLGGQAAADRLTNLCG